MKRKARRAGRLSDCIIAFKTGRRHGVDQITRRRAGSPPPPNQQQKKKPRDDATAISSEVLMVSSTSEICTRRVFDQPQGGCPEKGETHLFTSIPPKSQPCSASPSPCTSLKVITNRHAFYNQTTGTTRTRKATQLLGQDLMVQTPDGTRLK